VGTIPYHVSRKEENVSLSDDSVTDWRQHAATMLLKYIRNTVMLVWTALPSDFKGASLL